jgi:hypothetical protein
MCARNTITPAILAFWAIVSLSGCASTENRENKIDSEATSVFPMQPPIRNSTFNLITPTFPITKADFNKITMNMTIGEVEAILGRKSDMGEALGRGLGNVCCWWFEDNATIVIAFGPRGKMLQKSYTPTTHNEKPTWLRDGNKLTETTNRETKQEAMDPASVKLGHFDSVNLGMSGKMGPHTITAEDCDSIHTGMTRDAVEAIFGRSPNRVLRPGGSLGGQECTWFEENATIFVAFDCGGGLIDKSYTPNRRN